MGPPSHARSRCGRRLTPDAYVAFVTLLSPLSWLSAGTQSGVDDDVIGGLDIDDIVRIVEATAQPRQVCALVHSADHIPIFARGRLQVIGTEDRFWQFHLAREIKARGSAAPIISP